MGAEDVARQQLNVYRMQLLGATVVPVESGTRTLKDATNEALRDWVTNVPTTHYIIGSVVGPDPYPAHGARLPVGHRPRGARADAGALRRGCRTRWWPASAAARTRWASSPASSTIPTSGWSGSRPRARGSRAGTTAPRSAPGAPGVLHGSLSYLLQDADGQVSPAHSVSAGLDYPGVGPEHSYLRDTGRVRLRVGHRRRGARRVPGRLPARGDHPRARDRARVRLGAAHGGAAGPPTRSCWSASAAAATRTSPTWPRCWERPCDQRPGADRTSSRVRRSPSSSTAW